MKTLSIVIPTYNVEKYIDRCLRSILQEDILDEIELIIVNDGSKDNSLKIAQKYYEKYNDTIKIIDKENGGHGSTINAGLEIATGKYFKVIDSDDWVNIDEFSNFVLKLKSVNSDLVLTNYNRELVFSGESIKFEYNKKMKYNTVYEFEKFDFKENLGLDYFFMATSTFKTDILRKSKEKLDENTFYVDMEFVLFQITEIKDFIYFDFNIYRYFIGRKDQSMNLNSMIKNRKHHERVLKRLINFYQSKNISKVKRDYFINILTQMLNTHYITYCFYDTDKKHRNEIVEFDNFLKNKDIVLYNKIRCYAYIRWNRRTKFRFSSTTRHLFSRLVDAYEAKMEYRIERRNSR